MKNTPLYDGTIFHRCIKEFMVQGGDPLGRGTGGPGFRFEDEFQSGRKFDRPGLLAAMTTAVSDKGGDIRRAEARTYDDRPGMVDLVVRVRDLDHLKALVRSVKDISGVARVERTSLADTPQ